VADTYFDARHGVNGVRRLLVCEESTAFQVALAKVRNSPVLSS
jgi:hypothetical protein